MSLFMASSITRDTQLRMHAESLLGRFIAGYQLIYIFAADATHATFLAENAASTPRFVVTKIFHPALVSTDHQQESFLREAAFLRLLRHPHILPVLASGIEGTFPYVVTEYAPYGSLHDRFRSNAGRPFPRDEAVGILSKVGQALQYAHSRNVLHGSLKPRNILFNRENEVVITDFSLSIERLVDGDLKKETPYTAPEQVEGHACKESDQYAFACLAYELFTGLPPFTQRSFERQRTESIMTPAGADALPLSIKRAITRATANEPEGRYPDITAFMNALGVPILSYLQADNALPMTDPRRETVKFAAAIDRLSTTSAPRGQASLFKATTIPSPNAGILRAMSQNVGNINRFAPRRPWLLAFTLCIVLVAVISPLVLNLLFTSPHEQVRNGKLSARLASPTPVYSRISVAPQESRPTHVTVRQLPEGNPMPTLPAVPSTAPAANPGTASAGTLPTPTSAPQVILRLSPAYFSAGNCHRTIYNYVCEAQFSSMSSTTIHWYAYGMGLGSQFSPSQGDLVPGQVVNVTVYVYDTCRQQSGSFTFTTNGASASIPWKC